MTDIHRTPTVSAWLLLALLPLLTACGMLDREPEPTPSPPPPTATATATPTPTPTATAQPLSVVDDLRAQVVRPPEPATGAPCGVVDVLDFPVGPPNGDDYGVRWPFGRRSFRYDGKYHAGEDWLYRLGPTLGQPVYSIGHGRVAYAAPNGWGRDLGVVIVRHVFADGATKLSFYGHLEPSSVAVRAGSCVARGAALGRIGDPTTRPHLHFELRDHLPNEPGPGYWPTDPLAAGWEAPSTYIWHQRLRGTRGVQWTRALTTAQLTLLGRLPGGDLLIREDDDLNALDATTGRTRWTSVVPDGARDLRLDARGDRLYFATATGAIASTPVEGTPPDLSRPEWTHAVPGRGRLTLLTLPEGGLLLHRDGRLHAVGPSGDRRWQRDAISAPAGYVVRGTRAVLATQNPTPRLLVIDGGTPPTVLPGVAGRPALTDDAVFLLADDGVYRQPLGESRRGPARVYPLDPAAAPSGDIVALPDHGVLIAHRGQHDKRLLAVAPDGRLRWERSLRALDPHPYAPLLAVSGDTAFALTVTGELLSVDPATGRARRVLDTGDGRRYRGVLQLQPSDPVLLLDPRSGHLVAFDPQIAAGRPPVAD